MKIMLIGTGTMTSRLSEALRNNGHTVQAALPAFLPEYIELFDFKAVIGIGPESSIQTESLVKAAGKGKLIYLFTGAADGLAAWASAAGVPTFPYPPSEMDINQLMEEIRRGEGDANTDDMYRRMMIGGDAANRIQSGMAARKIAITSPKGGTGKTTVAVNLAVAFALSGVTVYLVDADGNAGAMQYHLRIKEVKSTLIQLLRRTAAAPDDHIMDTMRAVVNGGAYLDSFTRLENLPTLRVLTGLNSDDLGDVALDNEEIIDKTIAGLYDAGVASGGIVIMDVGINPSHPVHRAALRHAEAIAIVIKPEIPDLAETRRWIKKMIESLAQGSSKKAAVEFIGSRVKLCYNMVIGDSFAKANKVLQDALVEDKLDLNLVANAILPYVEPQFASNAVNGSSPEDILVWRYKISRPEELAAFTEAILGFATNFVPAVLEGAMRIGLIRGMKSNGKKKIPFFLGGGR